MASTTFTDGTTTVVAAWLNDVNTAAYTTVPAHSTTLASGVVLKDSSTGAASIPVGTTAQRPASLYTGLLRYNTTINNWEGYNGSAWGLLATGFASSGTNADITSMTALTAGGIPTNTILTANVANSQITPAKLSQPSTLTSTSATSSGTFVDITGIPSWAKQITLMLANVSTNGSSQVIARAGSGSATTTGYSSRTTAIGGSNTTNASTNSDGFGVTTTSNAGPGEALVGTLVFTLLGANTWICTGNLHDNASATVHYITAGSVTLSGALDRIRLTTVNGTDTFDAGNISIIYE